MAQALRGRDFLTLADYSREELLQLLDLADRLKQEHKTGRSWRPMRGKSLAMIFSKSSTRTRVAFEVAMVQLGGHALFLGARDLQLGRGETIADTGTVLSRYVDAIMIRTYDHADVVELAAAADVPVINGLTDDFHPAQALADLMTVREKLGSLEGVRIAYVGDGNNVLHSLMLAAAHVGADLTAACPEGYEPSTQALSQAQALAERLGCQVEVVRDPRAAVRDAHVVYTDVWTSMGQEGEERTRQEIFGPYQVNEDLMAGARPGAIFMHCLPAHRGEEVTDGVVDGSQSVVFDQAENRLHTHKALLASLL